MSMRKPFAITLDVGSSLANKTGSWRSSRPVYVDRLPPCNQTCPAGEDIQGWLFHAEGGDYERAWRHQGLALTRLRDTLTDTVEIFVRLSDELTRAHFSLVPTARRLGAASE